MAQSLLPKELDDLWTSTDLNVMPDDQFLRWMMYQLNAQLFDYLTLRSGRMAEQLDQLHAIQRERDEALRRYEAQINKRHQQLREIVVRKVRVGQLQTRLAQAVQETDELTADLAASHAMVQHLRAQHDSSANDSMKTDSLGHQQQ